MFVVCLALFLGVRSLETTPQKRGVPPAHIVNSSILNVMSWLFMLLVLV